MRNTSSSYSLFFRGTSSPFFATRRLAVSAVSEPTVSTVDSAGEGFSRRYCARWALTRATSTLGEKGFSM